MKLSGFRASVHSDGEKLKEYSVEVSPDGRKATCWVPSQSGKRFVVKCRIGKSPVARGRARSIHVYVDGRRMVNHVTLPHETRSTIKGPQTSDNTMRPFEFADIQMTDGDPPPDNTRGDSDEISTICLRIFLVESWRLRGGNPPQKYEIQDHSPAVISEREKKAVEHCLSLGDEQTCPTSQCYTLVYNSREPDLVFEFRYRSKAMLQALGIISPPKRETPPIIDVEDEDPIPPPKRQKAGHNEDIIRSMQAELVRLRRRMGEIEGGKAGPSGVKKEYDPAEIIDLT